MEHTDRAATDARIVALREADAVDGLRLSTAAGWEQTLEDWQVLLRLGQGFGVRSLTGQLIATGIALPHAPGIGWIGMLLVDAHYRRQGLATRLLRHLIDHLRDLGFVPMLDATPAGRLVYEQLGFVEIEGISRWRRTGGEQPGTSRVGGDLAVALAMDRQAFGADRSQLLHAFADRHDSRVLIDADRNGYALSRRGRTATHIGPVVTLDPARQAALLLAALQMTDGAMVVDIPDSASKAREVMVAAGFQIERPLTRMALARHHAFGVPEMVAAIAGPEFG